LYLLLEDLHYILSIKQFLQEKCEKSLFYAYFFYALIYLSEKIIAQLLIFIKANGQENKKQGS